MKHGRSACTCAIILLCSAASGCSLKYSENIKSAEDSVPEFVFSDAEFSRYEDNRNTLTMHADKLEQYKGGNKTYADSIHFSIHDKNGSIDTEGSCGLLASDSDKEKYSLYDGIRIFNHPRNVEIHADELRWNGRSEQLTSGRNDTVTIIKEDTTIRGAGFSASGISNEFAFTGAVSGSVDTAEAADTAKAKTEASEVPEQTDTAVTEGINNEEN